MEMTFQETQAALLNALNMVTQWEATASKLADRISEMKTCEHQWDRDTAILAEENGKDLSYYDAKCHKCGMLKSETF